MAVPSKGQNFSLAPPSIPIWQGFELDWGYNHRLAALGAGLMGNSAEELRPFVQAASGSGSDEFTATVYSLHLPAEWRSRFIRIEIPIRGKEGEPLYLNESLTLYEPLLDTFVVIKEPSDGNPALITSSQPAISFLNGFSLESLADPDRIQVMEFEVHRAYRIGNDSLRIPVSGRFQFDCRSLECKRGDKDVAYRLTLHIGILLPVGLVGYGDGSWSTSGKLPQIHDADTTLGDYLHLLNGISIQNSTDIHYQSIGFGFRKVSPEAHNLFLRWGNFSLDSRAAYKANFQSRWRPPAAWTVKADEANFTVSMEYASLYLREPNWLTSFRVTEFQGQWKTRLGAPDKDWGRGILIKEPED